MSSKSDKDSNQKTPLDLEDWRVDTLSTLAKDWVSPWSGQVYPAGSVVKKSTQARWSKGQVLGMTIPNATAILLNVARRAYESAVVIRRPYYSKKGSELMMSDEEAFSYLENMIEAVICAHTAVEAYVNELLPSDRMYKRVDRHGEVQELDKAGIERKASLIEKVGTILPEAIGVKSPKGIHRCYSDLQKLTRLRDRIIHMKSEDRKSSGPDVDTIWHQLLIAESPVEQAHCVVGYFVSPSGRKPRWLEEFPK